MTWLHAPLTPAAAQLCRLKCYRVTLVQVIGLVLVTQGTLVASHEKHACEISKASALCPHGAIFDIRLGKTSRLVHTHLPWVL